MKEIKTWAIDGIDIETGENTTYYIRHVAGVHVWSLDIPKYDLGTKEYPEKIYNLDWFNPTSEPYRVKVSVIPEIVKIEKL